MTLNRQRCAVFIIINYHCLLAPPKYHSESWHPVTQEIMLLYLLVTWQSTVRTTLRTPWSPQNIVSTTAPERAVLSALSLGVALWTGQSGASEVAETCFSLASIWLAFVGHVVLFWLWLPRRGRWTAPVDSEIYRKMCEMLGISVLKGYQVEAL